MREKLKEIRQNLQKDLQNPARHSSVAAVRMLIAKYACPFTGLTELISVLLLKKTIKGCLGLKPPMVWGDGINNSKDREDRHIFAGHLKKEARLTCLSF